MEELIVVKRSGQRVKFDGIKIAIAIKKAFDSVNRNYQEEEINKVYESTLKYITLVYKDRKTINVEDIQDMIETILKNEKYIEVYKEFSEYRKKRAESRKAFSEKKEHKFVKVIEQTNSMNKRMETPYKMLKKFGENISLEYTKSYIIDSKYVRAHDEGRIFIHNFSYFNLGFLGSTHIKLENCLQNNNCFFDILFKLINAKKEIKGEIAIDNIDVLLNEHLLELFKQKFIDKLKNYLQINDYLELVRFADIVQRIKDQKEINLVNCNDILPNERVKKIFDSSYNEALNEINEMLKQNLQNIIEFLNKEDIFTITTGEIINSKINEVLLDIIIENKKYENIFVIYKVTKKTPDVIYNKIANIINSKKNIKLHFIENDVISEFFANGQRIIDASPTGRSNIGNISVNLPRIIMKYKKVEFYKKLDNLINFAVNNLEFIFEQIGDKIKDNYQILFDGTILNDEKLEKKQKIRKVIKTGTLNINLVGLKESANMLNEKELESTIFKILKQVKVRLNEESKKSKLNYTFSAINSEASTYFIDIDKTVYGTLDKITKKEAYENICFVKSIKEAEVVSEYQKMLTGGSELEMIIDAPSKEKIIETIKKLIEKNIIFANLKVTK